MARNTEAGTRVVGVTYGATELKEIDAAAQRQCLPRATFIRSETLRAARADAMFGAKFGKKVLRAGVMA